MRCLACNDELTDFEATRRTSSGEFLDLCEKCLDLGDRQDFDALFEREDLRKVEPVTDLPEEEEYE